MRKNHIPTAKRRKTDATAIVININHCVTLSIEYASARTGSPAGERTNCTPSGVRASREESNLLFLTMIRKIKM